MSYGEAYDGVIDPASSAALAAEAADQASGAMVRAALSAKAADGSATAAAASLAGMAALLKGMGLPVVFTGTVLQVRLPDGTFTVGVDLKGETGGRGPVGPTPRVGTVTVGDAAVLLDDSDPASPAYDFVLPRPLNGWTPVLALVADGVRRVQRIVDWTGGQGVKPAIGSYVGAAGLVPDLASAVDVRGMPGVSGASFIGSSTTAATVALGVVSVVVANPQAFAPAQYEALISAADSRNAMLGQLQSYDPGSGALTLNVLEASGSGMHADWIVTAAAPPVLPGFIDDGFYDAPNPTASVVIGAAGAGSTSSAPASADDGLF